MPASFSIPLTGLAANDPVPGNYIEVNFGQGPASIGQGNYAVIFVGNRSTAGSATVDTVIYGGPNSALPLQTTQDAITLFGQGSPLHRAIKRFLSVNTVTPFYAVAVAESGGTAATSTITFTTAATGAGNVRTWVGDDFIDTAITSGDSVTTVALNVSNNINSKLDWSVTSSPAVGVITLTVKTKGPRGNWIRFASVITGAGVGTTSSATAPAFMTGGATQDSNVTALATILPYRYYYIVSEADGVGGDTQLTGLVTQVNTQATPTTGIRQRVFAGSVDTSGNVTTIATGLNAARAEIIWSQNSEVHPFEMAAMWVGCVAIEEAPVSFLCNFDFYGNTGAQSSRWTVKAPRAGTAPTRATLKAALNNGITPVMVNANGTTAVLSRITTKSLTSSQADYRTRDAHKVTILDRYADDLQTKFALNFAGKKIADDPVAGQRIPGTSVVTPRVALAAINKLTTDYDGLDLLQNTATIIANTICIREASPTTRMSNRVPLQPIDVLHQIGTAIDQL